MADLSILLVEDDQFDQLALQRHIEKNQLPYHLTVCETIDEARDHLHRNSYDVVLLDYLPRNGTAFDLLPEIQDSITIILTGQGDEEIAVQAIKKGAADYLTKDIKGHYLRVLEQTIERAIQEKTTQAELNQYRKDLEHLVNVRTAELTRINQSLVHEIEVRKRAEEKLEHYAYYDILTGLANRTLFLDHLETAIQRCLRRPETSFAVLYLDLDNFKLVNDSLGHQQGDKLLIQVASRLKDCVRTIDTVARLGGDEFVILLEDIQNTDDILHICNRILSDLSAPIKLDRKSVHTSCSIGVVFSTLTSKSAMEVLQEADIAMYQAKEKGKNCFVIFDRSMRSTLLHRVALESDLKEALETESFTLHYHPILNLQTGQIRGMEALLRWDHPVLGRLAPDTFLPLAEETGLIQNIDMWVLRTACSQLRTWHALYRSPVPLSISVNISSQHLFNNGFDETIQNILSDCSIKPEYVSLEITEHSLIQNPERSSRTFSRIKNLGASIHMDDFGTGYSSLSYLMQYPIDVVKIDRSFIQSIHKDDRSAALVRSILLLGHEIKMPMVAEGIEEPQELKFLQDSQCTYGQGFLFSKPLPADKFEDLLRDSYSSNFKIF